ncbi:hypothetical protein B0H19DRAFT_1243217 [Mycena capillaripes]|nr:hypothetical protein B0H19DRAFT_1243217 [Mycena capillaripes]
MAEHRPQNRGRKLAVKVDSDYGRFSHDSDAKQFQNQHENRHQNRHENRPESPTLTATIVHTFYSTKFFGRKIEGKVSAHVLRVLSRHTWRHGYKNYGVATTIDAKSKMSATEADQILSKMTSLGLAIIGLSSGTRELIGTLTHGTPMGTPMGHTAQAEVRDSDFSSSCSNFGRHQYNFGELERVDRSAYSAGQDRRTHIQRMGPAWSQVGLAASCRENLQFIPIPSPAVLQYVAERKIHCMRGLQVGLLPNLSRIGVASNSSRHIHAPSRMRNALSSRTSSFSPHSRLESGKTEARVLHLRLLRDPDDRADLELERLEWKPKLCLELEVKLGARKLA